MSEDEYMRLGALVAEVARMRGWLKGVAAVASFSLLMAISIAGWALSRVVEQGEHIAVCCAKLEEHLADVRAHNGR